MKTIYLVRHSEPIKNLLIDKGSKSIINRYLPLSSNGETLAKNLANFLFQDKQIKYIYSSIFTRTIDTAKYLGELTNINIVLDEKFNERKLGNKKNIEKEFWLKQLYDENIKLFGGESRTMVKKRMISGLKDVLLKMNDNESAVIYSHATAITFLLLNWCKLENAELKGKVRTLSYNGKIFFNDSFRTPEVFKLEFTNNELVTIKREEFLDKIC